MQYSNVVSGIFLSRPNRFIAMVEIEGQPQVCHVKNTGRCRELLIPGTQVYLQVSDHPARKTKYDLIAVKKGKLLVNLDSQAPNKAVAEYLTQRFPDAICLRPETVWGNSRFDFYIETPEKRAFWEVKGVTLEQDGVAAFPDAPTLRGVKHLQGLTDCIKHGYEACVFFVIQMHPVNYLVPNDNAHPEFGAALRQAAKAGVHILAMDCAVTPTSMTLREPVMIKL